MDSKLTDLNVLIIDEHPQTGALTREMVRSAGAWKVVVAKDCWEARRRLSDDSRDANIVIYDLDMDSPAGIEFLKDLKCRDRPPMIMTISSERDGAKVRKAIDLGSNAFVVKPFSYTQLQGKLKALSDRLSSTSAALA